MDLTASVWTEVIGHETNDHQARLLSQLILHSLSILIPSIIFLGELPDIAPHNTGIASEDIVTSPIRDTTIPQLCTYYAM